MIFLPNPKAILINFIRMIKTGAELTHFFFDRFLCFLWLKNFTCFASLVITKAVQQQKNSVYFFRSAPFTSLVQ